MHGSLAPSAAYFEGHFPGRPILPGITQIALVAESVVHRAGGVLQGIPHVRLRQLVLPGEALMWHAHADGDAAVRFELRRGTTVVTNGMLTVSDALAGWERTLLPDAAAIDTPPMDFLLPHRAPMRFVRRVLNCKADRIVCTASIPAACPLVRDGHAPAIVAIEAAAQAAGVREALSRIAADRADSVPSGYLVSLRAVEFAAATIPAECSFVVDVRLQSVSLPLSTYAIEACIGAQPVLRGTIGTFLIGA